MDYAENICQAVDTIIAKRLSELNFDITDSFTIFDDSDKLNGYYVVGKEPTNTFIAFGSLSYNIGDEVYITIPKGNWDETKFILGPKRQNRNSSNLTSSLFLPVVQTKNRINYVAVNPLNTELYNTICIEFEMLADPNYSTIEANWITDRVGSKSKNLLCYGNNNIIYSKQTHYLDISPNDILHSLDLSFDENNIKIKNIKVTLITRSNYSIIEELQELKMTLEKYIKGGQSI